MTSPEEKIARQVELEAEMKSLGITRYRETVAKAVQNKDSASTKSGAALLGKAIEAMSGAVEEFLEAAKSGGAGRRHVAVKRLKELEPEVISFLTARKVLNTLTSPNMALQSVCVSVGRAVQDEISFRAFAATKPGLWTTLVKTMIEERNGSNLRQAKLRTAARRYFEVEEWANEERFMVGAKCLDLLITSTGLCRKVVLKMAGGKTRAILAPSKEVVEWMHKADSQWELLSPVLLPMIVPPQDWAGPRGGGYLSNSLQGKFLVKAHDRRYLKALEGYSMPAVYSAVNAIQRTAWQINTDIHAIMALARDAGGGLGELPYLDDEVTPEFPEGQGEQAKSEWCRTVRTIRSGNEKQRSKRIALIKTLWVADKFKDEPEIFFPQILDFRGRVYSQPVFLNPQGPDYAKSLLRFATGKALGEEGAFWLAVHGANVFGYDKAGLQERADWVVDNEDKITATAAEPLDNQWWTEADKPWQFLAFCLEWAAFRREGYSFESKLPVALDGSCNGLQNFSMALRDEVGGAAVNLVPADKPADIYQRVADVVLAKLQAMPDDPMAREWVESGLVTRKLCKQPVMTLPYGARQYGMRSAIADFIDEAREEGHECFPEKIPAAIFIGRIIWDSIGEVVVAARYAMDFLQGCARVAAREQKALHWVAPSGFPVLQEYRETVGRRLKTQIGGEIVKLWLVKDGDNLDKKRQASGVSPNWVHSLDSAHLMATVNLATLNGVRHFAMVHDSFGSHAADTRVLSQALREAFVNQYRADVLAEFRESVAEGLTEEERKNLPPVPPMGKLDAEAVLDCDFFFA